MTHFYELPLRPTPLQEEQLLRQAGMLNLLRRAVRQSREPLAEFPDLRDLLRSLLTHTVHLERCRMEDERVRSIPVAPLADRQPALTGPGVIRLCGGEQVEVVGVVGEVQADLTLLPPWARALIGLEVGERTLFNQLMGDVPQLIHAHRVDWADVRQETYGWVLELNFAWDTYPPEILMRRWEDDVEELEGQRGSCEVARLMGWSDCCR